MKSLRSGGRRMGDNPLVAATAAARRRLSANRQTRRSGPARRRIGRGCAALAALTAVLLMQGTAGAKSGGAGVILYSDGFNVLLGNADGSGQRILAKGGDPVVPSPDGRRIAFSSGGPGSAIVVTDAAARHAHVLGLVSDDLQWSPDGSALAYTTDDGRIHIYRPNGASEVVPVAHPKAHYGLSWSPDGRSLAYPSKRGIEIAAVGDGSTQLLVAGADLWRPAWSPTGARIAFLDSSDEDEVWLINADRSAKRDLAVRTFAETPAWSPDGRSLAVSAYSGDDPSEIKRVDVASGTVTRLTHSSYRESSCAPSWSADGRIAYLRNRLEGTYCDSADVWVMDRDGRHKRRVSGAFATGFGASEPTWFPHQRRVVPRRQRPQVSVSAARVLRPDKATAIAGANHGRAILTQGPSTPSFLLWSLPGGRISKTGAHCENGGEFEHEVALIGSQLTWLCGSDGINESARNVQTVRLGRGKQMTVASEPDEWAAIARGRAATVFSTGRTIWRLEGTRKRVLRHEPQRIAGLAADNARVAVALENDTVEVLSRSGRLLKRFPLRAQTSRIVLAGKRVVAQYDDGIYVYALDGKLQRQVHAGLDVQLEDSLGPLVCYRAGLALHLLDLRSGHTIAVALPSVAADVAAALDSLGLIYSYTAAHTTKPYRIGYVPMKEISSAIR
jgi:Tol biopolymer transport system component